jgi:hypothetical protein
VWPFFVVLDMLFVKTEEMILTEKNLIRKVSQIDLYFKLELMEQTGKHGWIILRRQACVLQLTHLNLQKHNQGVS